MFIAGTMLSINGLLHGELNQTKQTLDELPDLCSCTATVTCGLPPFNQEGPPPLNLDAALDDKAVLRLHDENAAAVQTLDKKSFLSQVAERKDNNVTTRQIPTAVNAACANYVWAYSNVFELDAAKKEPKISFSLSYVTLGDAGKIVEGETWTKAGVRAGGAPSLGNGDADPKPAATFFRQ